MARTKSAQQNIRVTVSVSPDLHERLAALARRQTDDAGRVVTVQDVVRGVLVEHVTHALGALGVIDAAQRPDGRPTDDDLEIAEGALVRALDEVRAERAARARGAS